MIQGRHEPRRESPRDRGEAGWQHDMLVANRVFGRKWHPVILAALHRNGPMGFSELETAINDISSKVLSEDLKALERTGLIERTVVQDHPFRVEYAPTEAGAALEPVLEAIVDWRRAYQRPAPDGGDDE